MCGGVLLSCVVGLLSSCGKELFSNCDGCGSSLVVMRRGLFLVSVCRRLLSSCGSGCFLQLWHGGLLSTRGKGLLSNCDMWVCSSLMAMFRGFISSCGMVLLFSCSVGLLFCFDLCGSSTLILMYMGTFL